MLPVLLSPELRAERRLNLSSEHVPEEDSDMSQSRSRRHISGTNSNSGGKSELLPAIFDRAPSHSPTLRTSFEISREDPLYKDRYLNSNSSSNNGQQSGQIERVSSTTYAQHYNKSMVTTTEDAPIPTKHNFRAKFMSSLDCDTVDGIPIALPNTHNFRARSISPVWLGRASVSNSSKDGGKLSYYY